jgi:hypothetical protein
MATGAAVDSYSSSARRTPHGPLGWQIFYHLCQKMNRGRGYGNRFGAAAARRRADAEGVGVALDWEPKEAMCNQAFGVDSMEGRDSDCRCLVN